MGGIPVRRYWQLLATYLRPERRRVVWLAILLLGGIALQLIAPLLLRAFIDQATTGGALDVLLRIGVAFLVIALLTQGVSIAETYAAETVGWNVTNQLRSVLALHCLRLDMSFHNARTPGELIERIDGDVTTLANFFSRFVLQVVGNGLLLAGVLVLLFTVDWRVGLALTIFVVGALALMLRIRGLAQPHWVALREADATFYGFVGEQLSGTEDIRANGAVPFVLRRMAELMQRWLQIQRRATLAAYVMGMSSILLFAIGDALAFALSAYLYTAHSITIGTAYLIVSYTLLLNRPTEQLRAQLQDLQQASASIERVEELLAVEPSIADTAAHPLPAGPLAVAFEHVSFSYRGDEQALRDVSFAIAPGKVLGLLGRTGSGKSTVTRLLARAYDPTTGTIALSGLDLRDASLAQVRERIGLVTQEVQLFQASVRDNLTFFDERVPDAQLEAVLDDLGLGRWLRALPDGLDTPLAAGGGGLSAGEGQLLAFARVLLKDPDLVILDEASSRLDRATEQAVQRATERLLHGRTGIIIAHRLTTVQRADDILILDGGRVLEYGPRTQLVADPQSQFARLLRTGLEAVTA